MQERLIREMAKLRGGPAKLKVLCKEYDEQIEKIGDERVKLIRIRDLIVKLTSVAEEDYVKSQVEFRPPDESTQDNTE